MVVNVRHNRRAVKVLRHVRTWRVFHRGREITRRTFYLDGRRRVARAYLYSADGHPYLENGRVVTEELRNVTVRRGRSRA